MHGLAFVLYVVASGAIAWFLAKLLTRRAKEAWPRWVVAGVLAPVVFYLPLADEIVGKFQFERLCEQAKEVKIHGTIPVGEELYTPEGKWRIGLTEEQDHDERLKSWNRAEKVLDSYVRRDRGPVMPQEVPAAIPIRRYETKIYDAKTGGLLAEWRGYGTSGGWFVRTVFGEGGPFIGRPQCVPEIVYRSEINQAILIFKRPEATK